MTKSTEHQTSFEEHPEQGSMMKAALAVSALAQMTAEIRALQEQMLREVQTARENAASWRAIGDALKISRSAAQKYYGDLIE